MRWLAAGRRLADASLLPIDPNAPKLGRWESRYGNAPAARAGRRGRVLTPWAKTSPAKRRKNLVRQTFKVDRRSIRPALTHYAPGVLGERDMLELAESNPDAFGSFVMQGVVDPIVICGSFPDCPLR
jgi:hypothetical protein